METLRTHSSSAQETTDLVTFTEEFRNGKPHFCAVALSISNSSQSLENVGLSSGIQVNILPSARNESKLMYQST